MVWCWAFLFGFFFFFLGGGRFCLVASLGRGKIL